MKINPDTLADVMFCAGLGLMAVGCWMVYAPAAFIVIGGVLAILGIIGQTR